MEDSTKEATSDGTKRIASSFLTGGGGLHFEENVQTSFVVLMLSDGFAPCLENYPIVGVHCQSKHLGYETDDLLVSTACATSGLKRKLIGQVKHSISFTSKNETLGEVLQAAWKDFNNEKLFTKGKDGDVIVLITGPLSATDLSSVRPIFEKARSGLSCERFFIGIKQANFTSDKTRDRVA